MTTRLTRRTLLAGALAGAGHSAFAGAPTTSPRPVPRGSAPVIRRVDPTDQILQDAGLGGAVAFVVADATTGEIRAERLGDQPLPPASTLKSVTALYALDRLGPDHRFRTRLLVTGPVEAGRLVGDLILVSDGDPTLDTDRLNTLVDQLAASGIKFISGRFLVWGGALPAVDRIDPGQPDHVGYNPAIGGVNLNFNRVHFSWDKSGDGYDTAMVARGQTAAPETSVARMSIVDRAAPVFAYSRGSETDRWSVARRALGDEGARWLPVRHPARYAGDVLRALARDKGVRLPRPDLADTAPGGARDISTVRGPELSNVLRGMLRYSTNLTAEVAGMASSVSGGTPVANLSSSGARMAGWAIERHGLGRLTFDDHSGLGYGSRISAGDMVSILIGGQQAGLPGLLKSVNLGIDNARPAPPGVSVVAKTGTLNFVSALAGYVDVAGGSRQVFAILTADVARRDAVPLEARDRPDGGRSYARRSRILQKRLLRYWAQASA